MFENRHGKRSGSDDTYVHVEAKGHLDILERPEELRLRLDVLKESEERMEEKKKLEKQLQKDQDLFTLLDLVKSVKSRPDETDSVFSMETEVDA